MTSAPSPIREALQQLAHEHGGVLKPALVVDAARDPASPLHGQFEWDDSAAGAAYRILQARSLIRAQVTYERVSPERTVPVRVFVSLTPDRDEDGGGYRVVADVMTDEAMRLQMMADARQEMRAFRLKYERLTELADVFAAMRRVDHETQDVETASA